MTTPNRINANRANARSSTGPKTQQGRARSAKNAMRHGLSLPVVSDPDLSEEIETLAREIAGPGASAEIQECARRVAEAQIDLRRVRHARHHLLVGALRNLDIRLLWPNAADTPIEALEAPHLSESAKRLAAIERYERRALSRRNFAIRALDDVRLSYFGDSI